VVNQRLLKINEFIDTWCENNGVGYNIVCDEPDLQGLLFKKDKSTKRLLRDIDQLIVQEGIHLETVKVRGGIILVFSVKAISESTLIKIMTEAGGNMTTFAERVANAFLKTTSTHLNKTVLDESDFLESAKKIAEGQFKPATTSANRTSLRRQRIATHNSDDPQATTGASQPSKGPPLRFESLVAHALELMPAKSTEKFSKQLNETLQGMATPDDAQPGDLFAKFAKSLSVLGQNIGTGPLQDQLRKQGINWKKSDDGQAIILYIVNAQTNAPQPIARINAETLAKPSDFETQLLNIMDFAKGDAPGSFKQRQAELQAQEKAVREIAKSLGPQDQAIAKQMQDVQQPAAPPQAVTKQPAAAPQAAVQQAAMPKQL